MMNTQEGTTRRTRRSLWALLATLALLLSACGNGSEDTADGASTTIATDETTTDETTTDDTTTDEAAPVEDADSLDETSSDSTDDSDSSDTDDGAAVAGGRATLGSSVLSTAVDSQTAPTSGRFEGAFDIVSSDPEMAGAFSMAFSGSFDTPSQASFMELDFGDLFAAMAEGDSDEAEGMALFGDAMAEPIRVITIGEEAWMQWGFFSLMGVESDQWVSTDASETGSLTEGFGFGGTAGSPADFLQQFKDANADITELGTETVRGVETTHVRAVIDFKELAETLPADDREELLSNLGSAEGFDTLPIDFWIGEDGYVYRYVVSMDMSNMADSEGLDSVTITYEIYDYGTDVGIEAPDAALVVDGDTIGF